MNVKQQPVEASGAGEDEMQTPADLMIRVPVRASTPQLLAEV
jgi:hypothetical protein